MVFSKSILEKHHGFNINLGMKGKTIAYGEETELLMRLRSDMIDVFYVPTMHVEHLIDAERCSLKWQLKSYYADGKYSTVIFNIDIGFIQSLYLMLKAIVASPVIFFKEKDIPTRRRLFYSLRQIFLSAGNISGLLLKKNLRRQPT
jgi:GT2 family glycosyltransferase